MVKIGADDEKAFASTESFEDYRKKKDGKEEATLDIMPWLSRLTLDIIGYGTSSSLSLSFCEIELMPVLSSSSGFRLRILFAQSIGEQARDRIRWNVLSLGSRQET